MQKEQTVQLEELIGYTFKNKAYLETALTHSSYANEAKGQGSCNERQEFLGDAVLSIVVSDYLYKRYHMTEGDLTKLRASIVCEKSLYHFAQKLRLGEFLLLGKGEEMMGGRQRPSILADAFEALIAAIYLDSSLEQVSHFILAFVTDMLVAEDEDSFKDFKTALQEIIQKNPEEKVSYVLVGQTGPDHDKRFQVEVRLNSNVIGRGSGRSKKSAEQMAAKQALELMGQA